MWHRDSKRGNAVGNMVLIDMLGEGLPQTVNVWKTHVWSTIKQSTVQRGAPVFLTWTSRTLCRVGREQIEPMNHICIIRFENWWTFWFRTSSLGQAYSVLRWALGKPQCVGYIHVTPHKALFCKVLLPAQYGRSFINVCAHSLTHSTITLGMPPTCPTCF